MLRVVQVQFSFLLYFLGVVFVFGNMLCSSCCFLCSLFFFLLDVGCHDSPVCLFSVVVRGSAALFDFLGLQQYLCGVRVGQLGGVNAVLLWLV